MDGSHLTLYTNGSNSGVGLTERMRITSGGELLINTTTDAGDYKLQVNGQAYFGTNITTSSILFYNNSSTNTGIEITAGAGSQYLLADGTTTSGTGGAAFPFTGSAQITGSLEVTGSINNLLISTGGGNVSTNISIGATTNFSSSNTGTNNFAAGSGSLLNLTTGYNNIAIGRCSLRANTTGNSNTAIGAAALRNNTSGFNNTAIGRDALQSNTTGTYNIEIITISSADFDCFICYCFNK